MRWKVRRIFDADYKCTSAHLTEETAKLDVGRHLGALLERLRSLLPSYKYRNYASVPGFIDDVTRLLDSAGQALAQDDVWGTYDLWHGFLERWDEVFGCPIWAEVGTVVVDAPPGAPVRQVRSPPFIKEELFGRTIARPLIEEELVMDAARRVAADLGRQFEDVHWIAQDLRAQIVGSGRTVRHDDFIQMLREKVKETGPVEGILPLFEGPETVLPEEAEIHAAMEKDVRTTWVGKKTSQLVAKVISEITGDYLREGWEPPESLTQAMAEGMNALIEEFMSAENEEEAEKIEAQFRTRMRSEYGLSGRRSR